MITDEELSAIALAATSEPPVPDDAVALWELLDAEAPLVSSWYMPAPAGHRRLTGWRRNLVLFLVGVFLLIEAVGLCSAYGAVVIG
ncbi:MAG: hypothetical protein H0W70_00040 [Actinobacteria bacterium]|nr:hypothetical protein [Actinomycetota bacterium]